MSLLNDDLLRGVEDRLLPDVADLGFVIVEHEEWDSFDNARVVLASGEVRMEIARERGHITIAFTSVHWPGQFVAAEVVMELLGLSKEAQLHSRSMDQVFAATRSLLTACLPELQRIYSADSFRSTVESLNRLKKIRAERLWGPTASGAV